MKNKTNIFYRIMEASKRIFALACPMAGIQFITFASGFISLAMLSRLGNQALAASALIFSSQILIVSSSISILFSLSILIGHAYGERDYEAIGNYFQQSWILGALISIPIMLILWHIDFILLHLKQSTEIIAIVKSYFHAYTWCILPACLTIANMQFAYGINKKKIIFFTKLLSDILLMFSAYIFIFGKFGFPRLNVAGLGYAAVLQYSFFFVISSLFFFHEKSFSHFKLFQYHAQKKLGHFIGIFKTGFPIGVQTFAETLSFFVSSIMIGWISITALSAYQVVTQYCFLMVVPIFKISHATSIFIGNAYGEKKLDEIKILSYSSIAMTATASAIVAFMFITYPKALISFYINIDDPVNFKSISLIIIIFFIVGFTQLFDSLRNTFMGILRGLLDTRFPMYGSILTTWLIGLPLAYLLAFPFQYGAIGFVIGGMLGILSGLSIMYYRWHILTNRIINQLHNQKEVDLAKN